MLSSTGETSEPSSFVATLDAPLPIFDWKGILGVVTPILVTTNMDSDGLHQTALIGFDQLF